MYFGTNTTDVIQGIKHSFPFSLFNIYLYQYAVRGSHLISGLYSIIVIYFHVQSIPNLANSSAFVLVLMPFDASLSFFEHFSLSDTRGIQTDLVLPPPQPQIPSGLQGKWFLLVKNGI